MIRIALDIKLETKLETKLKTSIDKSEKTGIYSMYKPITSIKTRNKEISLCLFTVFL